MAGRKLSREGEIDRGNCKEKKKNKTNKKCQREVSTIFSVSNSCLACSSSSSVSLSSLYSAELLSFCLFASSVSHWDCL